MHANRVLTCVN